MKKMSITREFTKNALMDAFWQLYKYQDLDKITIKKITDKAGYSRITFYEYFEDIYDILHCIEIKILSEIEQKIQISIGDAGSISTDAFTEHMVSLSNEYHEFFSKLFGENGDTGFEEKLQNSLKGLLKKYSEMNMDFSNKYVVEFYTSGIVGSIKTWFRNGCDIPVEAFLYTINTVIYINT
ncbi:TetR/AcrR family transcriptional regulator [Pseudobacteroides cellulosolvens]|uniref:Putative transcriptional regulator, TetR family n=1 Tax=Pseudobacteroides cellulosolvens ATCC 35603 = DSM 2933 TaxID=398512 RepID=A0A0L6JHF5_9FIRM|nr:TetR/AcrR family transcriptional regulator [Pseudobacteroides cellulosolvens]KNY25266.1 putative transcriptional regulator, TetR family [Pseudobacteroides cellulosolvens ATCC 35603 = DSM 2933]